MRQSSQMRESKFGLNKRKPQPWLSWGIFRMAETVGFEPTHHGFCKGYFAVRGQFVDIKLDGSGRSMYYDCDSYK